MITSVATWRCKCGIGLKVITETDRARMADIAELKVVVACPRCQSEQILFAHRIVSIRTERRLAEVKLGA